MRKIFIILLLTTVKLTAQNRELVELVTKDVFENKSYIYTKGVTLRPPTSGTGSFRVSASEHGPFFVKPAAGANTPQNLPPSPGKNFLRTENILVREIVSENQIPNLTPSQIAITFEYVDGLGRSNQKVAKGQSPMGKDVVKYFTYDPTTGRIIYDYLPFVSATSTGDFKDNFVSEQEGFYGSASSMPDDRPFSKNEYESSPLDRIVKNLNVGENWFEDGKSSSSKFKIDITGNKLFWEYDESTKQPRLSVFENATGFYPSGTLTYVESIDEGDHITKIYSDFFGRTVLSERQNTDGTWLQTYSVIDGLGRLRVVFPPEASAVISQYTAFTTTQQHQERQDFLDQWAYQFIYDDHGRISKEKVPGRDWTYYVYDKWNRLVFSQDAEQRSSDKWSFIKYDRFNRKAVSGVFSTTTPHSTLQTNAMSISDENRFETQISNGVGYTLTSSFPTSGIDATHVHIVTYYDNYDFMYAGWDDQNNNFSYQNIANSDYPQVSAKLSIVKGYPTGSRVRILDDANSKWLSSVIYYDAYYNPIQVIDEADIGGVVRTTKKFDFIGRADKAHHFNSYSSLNEEYFYTYDHSSRIVKIEHSINGSPSVVVVSNRYDELGQLIEKNLHSTNSGSSYLQSVDYQYNIRGWITGINNSSLSAQSGDSQGDLFGMEIQYNSAPMSINGVFTTKKYYDGNISSIKWKTNTLQAGVTPVERIYGYDYDVLNRLEQAHSASNNSGSWNGEGGMFDEQITNYDRHGNILGLNRWGKVQNIKTPIDQLTYEYVLSSGKKTDQLVAVDDASGHSLGFKPASASITEEFEYDDNGNLEFDHNKSISSVTYNHLNLPTMVEIVRSSGQIGRIFYTYDALGNRLSRKINIDGSDVWTTRYSKTYQYDKNHATNVERLSYFLHPEGRVVNNGNGYEYEYFIHDYLGNARVGFGSFKETVNYKATMEPSMDSDEEAQGFKNLDQTRPPTATVNATPISERLPAPDRAAQCKGSDGTALGPAKYIRVLNGDVVYMEVYAQYNESADNTNNIASSVLVAALTGPNTFNIPNSGETASLWSGFNANATATGMAAGTLLGQTSNTPKAYLAYLFFDDNNNFLGGAADGVDDQALEKFQRLQRSFTATTNGHLYIYVVNENKQPNVNAFFDDLYIVHQKNNYSLQVTQATDYYPFGLPFNEYQSDRLYAVNGTYSTILRNRDLFQGKELEKESDLNWYDFEARMYDPALGRFNSVDPLGDGRPHESSYSFVSNNPAHFVDPDGRWWGLYPNGYVNPSILKAGNRMMSQSMQAYFIKGEILSAASGSPTSSYAANFASALYSDARHRQGNYQPYVENPYLNGDHGVFLQTLAVVGGMLPPGAIAKGIIEARNGDYGNAAIDLGSGAFELGALARSVKSVNMLQQITNRLSDHLEFATKNYTLSPKQSAAGLKWPNLMKAYTGSAIDKSFKNLVNNDEFLKLNNINTTGLFKFGPDAFHNPAGSIWWDVTTPNRWNAHETLYGQGFGSGIPLLYDFYPQTTTPYFVPPN